VPPSDHDALRAASLGGVVGVLAFACSLGFALVNPGNTDWLTAGDLRFHFLGWHTFRSAPWQLPPGANPHFGYPVGTSVALTDSIPIFAMTFKLLDPWLPARFQYIGLWLLVSHFLQGVFGALLVRCVTPRRVLQVLGAALFVTAPVLLHRTGHPALGAHWLLLAALWLHFRSPNTQVAISRPALGRWAVLTAVVAATHPYLGFMVLAVMAGHSVSVALRADGRQRAWIGAILTANVAWYAVVSWLSGYFVVGSGSDLVGENFGEYSMNGLSPIAPLEYSAFLGPSFFPNVVQTIEGYSYLGIGLIALAVPATVGWTRRRGDGSNGRRLPGWPLLLVMVILTAMALGPVIHLGNTVAFRYPEELWGPLRLFRANGRMFWPALYGITFAIVAGVCRLRPTLAVTLLAAAVVAQAVDLSRAYVGAQGLHRTTWQTPLAADFWRVVTPSYRHLVAIPPNTCSPQGIDFLPVALLAGDHGLSVNAAMAARYDVEKLRQYCRQLGDDIVGGRINPDVLYVLQPASAAAFMRNAEAPLICARVDGHVACVREDTADKWRESVSVALERVP
jgi:hypothetical protein